MHNERPVGGCSLLFQLILLISFGWSLVWFIATLTLLVIKYTTLPFPVFAFPAEVAAAALVLIVQFIGFSFGKAGNLCEEMRKIGLSLLFLILCAVGSIYYMCFQSYVLKLDVVFSSVYLGINCLAVFLGLWAMRVTSIKGAAPFYIFGRVNRTKNTKKSK